MTLRHVGFKARRATMLRVTFIRVSGGVRFGGVVIKAHGGADAESQPEPWNWRRR